MLCLASDIDANQCASKSKGLRQLPLFTSYDIHQAFYFCHSVDRNASRIPIVINQVHAPSASEGRFAQNFALKKDAPLIRCFRTNFRKTFVLKTDSDLASPSRKFLQEGVSDAVFTGEPNARSSRRSLRGVRFRHSPEGESAIDLVLRLYLWFWG